MLPVKSLIETKSRLRYVLDDRERANLTINLLKNTIRVLQQVGQSYPALAGILVISPDEVVLEQARKQGASILLEKSITERNGNVLNKALAAATTWLLQNSPASGLLVLPCDLPLITPQDVVIVLSLMETYPAVICSDRTGQGTNTLGLQRLLAQDFPYSFGEASFSRHCHYFQQNNISFKVCERAGFVFDLDQPEDFAVLPPELKKQLLAEV